MIRTRFVIPGRSLLDDKGCTCTDTSAGRVRPVVSRFGSGKAQAACADELGTGSQFHLRRGTSR